MSPFFHSQSIIHQFFFQIHTLIFSHHPLFKIQTLLFILHVCSSHKTKTTIMSIQTVTEREIRQLSLPLIGSLNVNFRRIEHERFKAKFGVTVELCAMTWNLMVSNLNMGSVDLTYICLRPVHILYALFFLKCYPTAHQTTANLGHSPNMRTFRKYTYFVI